MEPGIQHVTISHVLVNSLGWRERGGRKSFGPNSLGRLFSFGVYDENGIFCGGGRSFARKYKLEQNFFKNWDIFVDPLHASLVFVPQDMRPSLK